MASLHLIFALGLAASPAFAQPAATPQSPPTEKIIVTAPADTPDAVLRGFVKSYTAASPASGKVARWQAGMCPGVAGLPAGWDKSVTARLREIASLAGAPVAPQICRPNIDIVFTKNPQALLDEVRATREWLLGYHDAAQAKQLATAGHAIQAWYLTQTVDANGGIYTDDKLHGEGFYLQARTSGAPAGNTFQFPNAHVESWNGSRLGDERRSELGHVLIVVDLAKVDGIRFAAVTDAVAMLALAQTTAFDTCQPLASIANLTSAGCDVGLKTDKLSASDLAYLQALYSIDLRDSPMRQKDKIVDAMRKSLARP